MSSGNTGEWFDDEAQPGEDLEYRKLQDSIKKDGYREAISSSRDSSLQRGFEMGFAKSAPLCLPLGEMRGKLEALLKYHSQSVTPELLNAAWSLVADVADFSSRNQKVMTGELGDCELSAADFVTRMAQYRLTLQSTTEDLLQRGNILVSRIRTERTLLSEDGEVDKKS